ncbi:Ankyrin-1 [Fusarium oxysporum f. sp. rapae]|uniref:Ankyrin-1 n=1 Tax=Fusarium oxysporum f. sp. rapae TaxID=485398 RepID=A0A8J5NMP3_FUSOX|nr:Ankyrin-1 [Fusarium oxysporum f. sp. rapae]
MELTKEELQYALATRSKGRMVRRQDLPFEDTMISVCTGLVALDEQSRIIRLVHYTTQEYLAQNPDELLPFTEQDIARTCMAHLWVSENERYNLYAFNDVTTHTYPLWWYSAVNWGHHARDSAIPCHELEKFLDNEAIVNLAMRYALKKFQIGYLCLSKLHIAAHFGLAGLVEDLVDRAIEVDPADLTGRTPLSYAAEQGHETIVALLLRKGAQVDSQDHQVSLFYNHQAGRSPLSFAAEHGHESVVSILISYGASVSLKCLPDWTPVSFAVKNGHERLVRLLLKRDPSQLNIELVRATKNGHGSIVRMLLEMGAEVNCRTISAFTKLFTPLFCATYNNHEDIVQLLLEKGADPDPTNGLDTPFLTAASKSFKGITKLLLETGKVEIDRPDRFGRTPLSYVAQHGYEIIVTSLLEMGANPNSRTKAAFPGAKYFNGRTPLSFAAEYGHETVVEILIAKGTTVETKVPSKQDANRRTPFLYAVKNGHEGVIRTLLKLGHADPNTPDAKGRTPLSYAAENGLTSVVHTLLQSYNTVPGYMDVHGHTPLSYASQKGHVGVIRELLVTGNFQPDSMDGWGLTPLCYAALWGYEAVVRLLLDMNANLGYAVPFGRWQGETAVTIATGYEHKVIVDLLKQSGGII